MAAENCRLCPELRGEVQWYREQLAKRDATIADLMARLLAIADPMTSLRMQAIQQRLVPRDVVDPETGEPRERKGPNVRRHAPGHIRRTRPDRMSEEDLAASRQRLKLAVEGGGNPPERSDSAGPKTREAVEASFEQVLRPADEKAG